MDGPGTQPTPHLMATPHPLWLGAILLLGGVLGAADGHWGLAWLFFAFSGTVAVGALLGRRRRRRGGAAVAPTVPPQR